MADSQETDDIDRVEMKNKEELYGKIREQGIGDSEAYYAAFRQMYFCDGIFKAKKSKDLLEKVMLEIHPSLQYS